jgi:hypothetical protein
LTRTAALLLVTSSGTSSVVSKPVGTQSAFSCSCGSVCGASSTVPAALSRTVVNSTMSRTNTMVSSALIPASGIATARTVAVVGGDRDDDLAAGRLAGDGLGEPGDDVGEAERDRLAATGPRAVEDLAGPAVEAHVVHGDRRTLRDDVTVALGADDHLGLGDVERGVDLHLRLGARGRR